MRISKYYGKVCGNCEYFCGVDWGNCIIKGETAGDRYAGWQCEPLKKDWKWKKKKGLRLRTMNDDIKERNIKK